MEKIELLLPDGSTYFIDDKPGLTYIIGPNGTGKSYALKKFARENMDQAIYILPTRDDVRRNLTYINNRDESDFLREWRVYEQVCQYWNKAVKQPGLLALAFSFLELLGVPQRVCVSSEDGGVKFSMSEHNSCELSATEAPGLLNLPLLGIAVYDPDRRIVIIDEPEQSLHPQAQHIFIQVLRRVARLQGKHFILITHSPSMIDLRTAEDLSRVVFFRRPKNYLNERKVYQVDPADAQRYAELFPSLTTYKREVFFADKVILVEGQHDRDLLLALIETGGFSVSLGRTSVLPLGGVGFMAKYTAFFKEIGVKPFVICDRDVIYPSSSIRWHSGRMEGEVFDWRGWVNLSQARAYAGGEVVNAHADWPSLQPAEFEVLEQCVANLRRQTKKAMDFVDKNKENIPDTGSLTVLLNELGKKEKELDYREYRAFHYLMTAVLNSNDWSGSIVSAVFRQVLDAYDQMEAQAEKLDILILRRGRIEDIYRHSGRLELSKTERSQREAADIKRHYVEQQEQIDEDYHDLIRPLTGKRFLVRMNNGIPHEAAAVLSGKIHEIYDYLFGAGDLLERIRKLETSGKLEELSSGARIVKYAPSERPRQVIIEIPLLKGYLGEKGHIIMSAGVRPDVFRLLYRDSAW